MVLKLYIKNKTNKKSCFLYIKQKEKNRYKYKCNPRFRDKQKNPQIPKQPKSKRNDNVNILLEVLFWILTSQSKQISDSFLIVFLQKRQFFLSKVLDIIISSF